MKEIFSFFKRKVVMGLLLLLPITLVAILLTKLWSAIRIVIVNVNTFLGIEEWMGMAVLVILTAIALIFVCFLAGVIAQLASISLFRTWVERRILKHFPGYVYVQMMLDNKFGGGKSGKSCVMVRLRHVWQPGVLIEENEYCGVVYLPNCPHAGTGITCIVDKEKIRHIDIPVASLNDSLERFGEGLADVYAQYIRKNAMGESWRNYQ